jgi:diguanylate cyclase (GGDEF)-like protein
MSDEASNAAFEQSHRDDAALIPTVARVRVFRYRWLIGFALSTLVLLGVAHSPANDAAGLLVAVVMLLTGAAFWLAGREQARRLLAELALGQALLGAEETAGRLRALIEFGELMQSCRSLAEAMTMLRSGAPTLVGDGAGAVYLFAPGQLRLTQAGGWGRARAPLAPELPAHAARQPGESQPHEFERVMRLPLVAQGETLGVLVIESDRAGDREQRRVLRALAEQLALSLANLQMQESLRALSLRDPLTGLFNRRFLDESMERELARAARRVQPLSLIVIDVDHFKSINDGHGHDAGDMVLVALADVLRANSREEDIASRYGGEEFVLVMPGASCEQALRRAEELRQAIAAAQVRFRGRALGTITASFGVASSQDCGLSAAGLFHAADQALYQSKRDGRNRVTAAPFANADSSHERAAQRSIEVGDRAQEAVAQCDPGLPCESLAREADVGLTLDRIVRRQGAELDA